MGLKDVLSKMKLIELSEPAVPERPAVPGGPAAAASASAIPDLDQLLASLPPPKLDERALEATTAAAPASPSGGASGAVAEPGTFEIPDFAEIYRAAGIEEPAHGFSAFKVLEILSSPDFAPLDGKAKAAALAGFLKMNPAGAVPLAEVIQDAVRRDQALDRFEGFLQGKLETRTAEIERENAALQAEIDELAKRNRERMDANRSSIDALAARLSGWREQKRAEERRLFEAVAPFVDQNPISTGAPSGAPAPRE